MHLQPVFADGPAYANGTSERFFRTGLSLPSGSALSDEQFDRVVDHDPPRSSKGRPRDRQTSPAAASPAAPSPSPAAPARSAR